MSYHGGYAIEGAFPARALLCHFQKGNIPLDGIKVDGEFAPDQVHGAAFSPDGKLLALGGRVARGPTGLIRLLDTATGKLHSTFTFPPGQVDALAYTPDGKLLIAVGGAPADRYNRSDGPSKIVFWDTVTGQVWPEFETKERVRAFALSPDGRLFATGGDGEAVILWDKAASKQLALLQGHTPPVYALSFSPDGTKLAYTCGEKAIYLWDLTKTAEGKGR